MCGPRAKIASLRSFMTRGYSESDLHNGEDDHGAGGGSGR
jgi:hypothetical protein